MIWLLACTNTPEPVESAPSVESSVESSVDSEPVTEWDVVVTVLLDGQPVQGATVLQGGYPQEYTSDAAGQVTVPIQTSEYLAVIGSWPTARQYWADLSPGQAQATIELTSYDPTDNAAYTFRDPGEPDRRDTTSQCMHCHVTIGTDWIESPHATSASNPAVQALYAELPDEAGTGQCADCHAPGIDGELGGRELSEAEGHALDYGVHCDVCHRVDEVDVEHVEPGVGGRLKLHRPGEDGGVGFDWQPLVFGPYPDVPNIAMGSVQRDHFTEATLCAGCHEHDQEVWAGDVDLSRWPSGRIPVHSTYSEWKDGPLSPAAPCQSCHMPPDPDVGNSSDLGNVHELDPGIIGGWYRAAGSVRSHSWVGPRAVDSNMLELAAEVFLETSLDDGVFTVHATTKNVGPGHAIPTGEPLRNLVLRVEASCGDTTLTPTGGHVVPDWGGYVERRVAGEDWVTWDAESGDRVRVVTVGDELAIDGVGAFATGGLSSGMADERFVGEVAPGETPPDGDVAYLVRGSAVAGAPGFGFARVHVDADGERMVPHAVAVDVASDNRLKPQQSWTSTHTFEATCEAPTATAYLVHRAWPWQVAQDRGWDLRAATMVEASK